MKKGHKNIMAYTKCIKGQSIKSQVKGSNRKHTMAAPYDLRTCANKR